MDAPQHDQPRHSCQSQHSCRQHAIDRTAHTARFLAALGLALWFSAPAAFGTEAARARDAAPPTAALTLTDQQQLKLGTLEGTSRAQAGKLLGQVRQIRHKLEDLYSSYTFGAGDARRLNQELNRVQGQLLDLRLSEQQQLRAILSADQFARLQAAIRGHNFRPEDGPRGGTGDPDRDDPRRHRH